MRVLREGDTWPVDVAAGHYGDAAVQAGSRMVQVIEPGIVRNRFVGVGTAPSGELILSLPKVFSGIGSPDHYRILIQALFRYIAETVDSVEKEIISQHANKLHLFHAIAASTHTSGWHIEDSETVSDLLEHVNWTRTAESMVGIEQDHGILFPETVGVSTRRELGQMAPIQAIALKTLASELAEITNLDPGTSHLLDEAESIIAVSASSPDVASEILSQYISGNRDHERDLASLLQTWLSLESYQSSLNSFFGTTSFPHMWEEMLKSAIWSVASATVLDHKLIASQPVYLSPSGSVINTPKPQRPDIAVSFNSLHVILDAKWYSPDSPPGTPDIVKQFAYAETSHLPVDANAFLMPSTGNILSAISHIEMRYSGTVDNRFSQIQVLGIPVSQVFAAYSLRKDRALGESILQAVVAPNLRPPAAD